MSEDSKDQKAFEPEDVITNERQKDKDEFDKAFDEAFSGISEEGKPESKDTGTEPKAKEEEPGPAEGVATKEEGQEPEGKQVDTPAPTGDSGETVVSVGIDYKARSEELTELLTKEQQRNNTWHGRIKAANARAEKAEARVAELEKENEALKSKSAPADKDDNSGDAYDDLNEFYKDFPELKGNIDKLIQKQVGNKPVVKEPKPEESTTKEGTDSPEVGESSQDAWERAVTTAHGDWRYHVSSGKLLAWIQKQPEHIRPGFESIYQNGTAPACINLLTEYKRSTGQLESDTGVNPKQTVKPQSKQAKIDAMREVSSSGAQVGVNVKQKKDMSYDEAAKEAGLV